MRASVLWVAVLVSMSAYSQTSSQQLDLASLPETPSTSKVLSANSEEHSSAAFIVQPVTPTVPSLVILPAQQEAKRKSIVISLLLRFFRSELQWLTSNRLNTVFPMEQKKEILS